MLVVALVAALLALVWLAIRHAAYRSTYAFTQADLEGARKDSRTKSRSVTLGKTQEQLAPLFPEFLEQFNPNDARFLGSPLDFVVFDGLCEDGEPVRKIVFVEVKTGRSRLSTRERRIRDAVEDGRVSFQLLRLPGVEETLDRDLLQPLSGRPAILQR